MGEIRDKTTKWLWHLAPSHMKEGNKPDTERDSYKLFSIWAKNAENFKTKAYEVRRNRFPQWATPDALNLLGKERGIKPLKGEGLEDFRTRVINALQWWQLAGSVKGLKTIFKPLGFTDVEIKEVLKKDPKRWAEFEVYLEKEVLTPEDADKVSIAKELINQLKPAHEKLAGLTITVLNTLQQTLFIGFSFQKGKHYTIGLRINPKVEPLNLYHGGVIRKSSQTTIGVHKPTITTQAGTIYTGTAFRVAKITTIYPA